MTAAQKGRVRGWRNQGKEDSNERRMPLSRSPDFDFRVWEIRFPVVAGGEPQSRGELKTHKLLFSLHTWMTLGLLRGPHSPAVTATVAYAALGGLSQDAELPTLARALGGFVVFCVCFSFH